jgi:indole-3-glycerol phosphate synthase
MLERFREAKREEIENLRSRREERGETFLPTRRENRPSFETALRNAKWPGRSAVVAEYKRASPSLGNINLTLTPEDAARRYAQAGGRRCRC